MDEKTAILRLKSGDIGGLEILVALHQRKAVQTAFLITRDPDLAQDVVQDCYIQVFRSIRSFDPTRPFEPWFLRSVVNAAVKAVQSSWRQMDLGREPDDLALEELAAQVESVEAQVESLEFQDHIWEAMKQLSPRQRAVLVQRYYLEMSEREMAQHSGTAAGTVKWLLNAARKRLRGLISERSEP